jgi:3',5'-cyclic AMP phosphodiesterase CpdA
VRIAHLSDLHLRDAGDAAAFERQLDRVVAGAPGHLVMSGDLLDRWHPRLLQRALDALQARDLLTAARCTIIHGNHDLASSGGHPRSRADLPRLVLRGWDPPPLLAARRRRFYRAIEERAPGVAGLPPAVKDLGTVRLAAIDSVLVPWRPLGVANGRLQVRQGLGCIRPAQADWLARALPGDKPSILVLHHYPLPVPAYAWNGGRLEVGMEIPAADRDRLWRAVTAAGITLLLCGHVHRARLEWHQGIAVGLQGQSGAAWAGRSIGWYELDGQTVRMEVERADAVAG